LNWVDLIMAIVLIGFAIRGLMKGFFRELFSLVGLFIGLWVALLKFVPVGEWLQTKLPLTDPLPFHAAFLAIFLGISALAGVCGYLLHKVAKVFFVGWLDAVVGLGFGLIKGVVILTILLFLLAHLPLSRAVATQLRTSTIVGHLELLNPFVAESVQAYKRFGGERLWERLRVPVPSRPPVMGMGAGTGWDRWGRFLAGNCPYDPRLQ
jgi:membrane protein required for colicin V production